MQHLCGTALLSLPLAIVLAPIALSEQGRNHGPTHTMSTPTLNDRYDRGREAFGAMLRAWLASSGLSYSQLQALGKWATGGMSWISTSQLTKMRNDRSYSPAYRFIEALAASNEAIRVWREEGPQAARSRYGPLQRPLTAGLMDACIWLPDPASPQRSLGFLDLIAIFVGLQPAPQIAQPAIVEAQASVLSDAIGRRLDQWLAARGGVRAGFQELLTLYDVADLDRIARLRDVVIGVATFSPEQLEEELPALCWLFSAIEQRELNRRELLALLTASPAPSDHRQAAPQTPPGPPPAPRRR